MEVAEIPKYDLDNLISGNVFIYGTKGSGKTTLAKNIIKANTKNGFHNIKIITLDKNEYSSVINDNNIHTIFDLSLIIDAQLEEQNNRLILIIDSITHLINDIKMIMKRSKELGILLVMICDEIIDDNDVGAGVGAGVGDYVIMFNDINIRNNIEKYWLIYGDQYDKNLFINMYDECTKNKYECLILDMRNRKYFWYKCDDLKTRNCCLSPINFLLYFFNI
jgi:AAA+ ATPase superfamily predicted ATPase